MSEDASIAVWIRRASRKRWLRDEFGGAPASPETAAKAQQKH